MIFTADAFMPRYFIWYLILYSLRYFIWYSLLMYSCRDISSVTATAAGASIYSRCDNFNLTAKLGRRTYPNVQFSWKPQNFSILKHVFRTSGSVTLHKEVDLCLQKIADLNWNVNELFSIGMLCGFDWQLLISVNSFFLFFRKICKGFCINDSNATNCFALEGLILGTPLSVDALLWV